MYVLIILLGFKYLASSIPSIVFAGVGVGVGLILAMLLNSMARNPLISNNLVIFSRSIRNIMFFCIF